MSKINIPYESIPEKDIPERQAVPQAWLDILELGDALVIPAQFRSAVYQRFRKQGLKIKTKKVGDNLYISLA